MFRGNPHTPIFPALYLRPLWLLLLSFNSLNPVFSQPAGYILVDGVAYIDKKPASSVDVKVFLNGNQVSHVRSVNNGTFQCNLRFNNKYKVSVGKSGFVTKHFIINTEIPYGESVDRMYLFPLQVDLFPPFEEVDMSLLDEPMAYIEYDRTTRIFSFDLDEATERVARVRALQKEIEAILEVKARLFKLEFENAERALKKRSYALALDDYRKALRVYPESSARLYINVDLIQDRIALCTEKLAEKEAKDKTRNQEKQYSELLQQADKAFEMKIYDEAIEQYRLAAEIMPGKSHPKNRINRIRDLMSRNIVLTLVSEKQTIPDGTTKKLSFIPIGPGLRQGNYLLLKIRNMGVENTKLFVKFGQGNEASGGFVIKPALPGNESIHYIRLSANDLWIRNSANWVSLYPEGGDIEVYEVRLSRIE